MRATVTRYSRTHEPAAKSKRSSVGGDGARSSTAGAGSGNPLFNTDKFGQHILKVGS